uniref:Uncharacterized protein n=1 Tax=Quercus lobata TaxID=97700 RepID=A0A7N2LE44_QUELO
MSFTGVKVLLSLRGRRRNVELRSVDRQKVEKKVESNIRFTSEYMFSFFNEYEKKEFARFEAEVGDLIGKIMSRAEFRNMEDILENSYSDERFILLLKYVKLYEKYTYTASVKHYIYELENAKLDVRDSGMTFWDLESEVVKVGGYMVSRNFELILKSLFEKFGDFSADSTLNPRTKTRFINIFGGVAHSMCNTQVTTDLLFNWWKNFKLVQHAEFNIQFALDKLYKLAQSWFCLHREFLTNETLLSYHVQIRDLTTKFEELKVKQKQCVASTKRESLPEMERWIADIELISKTPRTCFL